MAKGFYRCRDCGSTRVGTWAEMFPEGRTIFYEGDDPDGFRKTVKEEFGFDVAETKGPHLVTGELVPIPWGEQIPGEDGEDGFTSYSFHCPAEHLDAIYASGRFPMGS